MNIHRRTHTIQETAQILGISKASLYKEIANGTLRTLKIGRRRFVTGEAIETFLAIKEQHTQQSLFMSQSCRKPEVSS